MKWKKRISVLFILAALMLFYGNIPVLAHDVPDMNRTGTINVSVEYDGQPVSGGTLSLYRVGDVAQDDGNYGFALNSAFAGSQASLDDLESDSLAKKLASYAEANGLSAQTETIGTDGRVAFSDLELGLYLLVQQQAANGFEKMDPFLVSLPMVEDGTYIYQVDASPKLEIEKAEVPPKQPKTGDTTSSAPYVALAGLSLCIIAVVGRILYVRNRQNHYGE